jgi:hypothetical protein
MKNITYILEETLERRHKKNKCFVSGGYEFKYQHAAQLS